MKPTEVEAWAAAIGALLVAIGVPAKWLWGVIQRHRQRSREMAQVERSTAWDTLTKQLRDSEKREDRLIEELQRKDEELRQANADKAELYERLIESDAKNEAATTLIETVREEFRRLQRSAPSATRADDAATQSTDTLPHSLPRPPRLPRTRK